MAFQGQQSGDIRATLALSQAEADAGTMRTLNLPGGRQIFVSVPAYTRNGQEIRLEGQGELTPTGQRGALILTIAIAAAENFGSSAYPLPEEAARTDFIPTPPPPPGVTSANYPSVNQQGQPGAFTNYPPQAPQSGTYFNQTLPAYGQPGANPTQFTTPAQPFQQYGAIPQKQLPPPQIPPQLQQPQQQPRRRSGLIIAVVIILVLLVIGGSGLILFTTVIQPAQVHSQMTATAQSQTTSTAQTNNTATAQTNATAQAQANANGTATAQVVANTTATATALQSLYTQSTSGTPTLNDPLTGQDGNNWEIDSKTGGGGCAFAGGSFRASMPQTNFFSSCYAQATNFSNFALRVQMTIISGDEGGVIFRGNSTTNKFYLFRISQSGSYNLFLYTSNNGGSAQSLLQGSTSAMHTGLGQRNEIAIIARGSNIYVYINQQHIGNISDGTYASGAIALFGEDATHSTVAAFSDLQVWSL